jgi:hypothetical protein
MSQAKTATNRRWMNVLGFLDEFFVLFIVAANQEPGCRKCKVHAALRENRLPGTFVTDSTFLGTLKRTRGRDCRFRVAALQTTVSFKR